jgi:hypothetical protein
MKRALASTGTAQLLEILSEHVPDGFINSMRASRVGRGRRAAFSAAQLWRAHLLALLTPVHHFNLLVEMLPEQRDWRRFARLSHRHRTPDVRMLHQWREAMGVMGLRAINRHLVGRLLEEWPADRLPVAIMDATDLPAAAADRGKKGKAHMVGPTCHLGIAFAQTGWNPFLCWL